MLLGKPCNVGTLYCQQQSQGYQKLHEDCGNSAVQGACGMRPGQTRDIFKALFALQGMLLCCKNKEPCSAAFYFTVCVPAIAYHSCLLQTRLCSTCTLSGDTNIGRVVRLLPHGNEFQHITNMWGARRQAVSLIFFWDTMGFFWLMTTFCRHALSKISHCVPFGSFLWGQVLGIIACGARMAGTGQTLPRWVPRCECIQIHHVIMSLNLICHPRAVLVWIPHTPVTLLELLLEISRLPSHSGETGSSGSPHEPDEPANIDSEMLAPRQRSKPSILSSVLASQQTC